jgi:integrase
MALVKHGTYAWYFRFTYKGKTYFGSTKTGNKVLAQRVHDQKKQEIIKRQDLGEDKQDCTVEECLNQFAASRKNTPEHTNIAGKVRKLLGKKTNTRTGEPVKCFGLPAVLKLSLLKESHVQHYVMQRRVEGNSDRTIVYELSTLTQAIKLAARMGFNVPIINVASIRKDNKLKIDNKKLRFLSIEEELKLLDALDPAKPLPGISAKRNAQVKAKQQRQDLYDLVILLLDTGARYSEIAKLQWRQVMLKDNAINLWRSKVKNESILYLTDRARAVLERRARNKAGLHVFAGKDGKPRGYSADGFDRAVARAGLENVTFHTLRHTNASRLVANGVSLYAVQQLLGHSTSEMTSRYAHLAPNQASAVAVGVLNRVNGPQPVDNVVPIGKAA